MVNAVSLNSVIVQSARIVGPAFAGLLIAGVGVGPCFAVNVLSFGAMIYALWGMDPAKLRSGPRATREPGAIRAGLRYVRATPELAIPLALMALVGTFGFNFQVILPLLARFSFGGGAGVYAALVSAMAVGSVAGALVTGSHGRTSPRLIAGAALAFGGAALLAAAAPAMAVEIAALVLLGRRLGHLRRNHQLLAPAGGNPPHARPSDVPLLSRLPRLDPHRRPPGRLALPSLRPPLGPPASRNLRPMRRLGSPHLLHPPPHPN